MPRHTLHAYVDGCDLEEVVDELLEQLEQFVAAGPWIHREPWVVNQRHEEDNSLALGDRPLWDLGLNVELPDPGTEPPGWFADVERIARFLGGLHAASGRDFVIGIHGNEGGYSEDLH